VKLPLADKLSAVVEIARAQSADAAAAAVTGARSLPSAVRRLGMHTRHLLRCGQQPQQQQTTPSLPSAAAASSLDETGSPDSAERLSPSQQLPPAALAPRVGVDTCEFLYRGGNAAHTSFGPLPHTRCCTAPSPKRHSSSSSPSKHRSFERSLLCSAQLATAHQP
jgi:hypothetical protein